MAIPLAEITSVRSELSNLKDEELKDLLNNQSNDTYDKWINRSEQVKAVEAERDMLMASVRSLAEYNLSRQSDYESDRSKLFNCVSEARQLKDSIQSKEAKLLELAKRTSLDSTLSAVLAAAAQAEEDSEDIAKEFLASSIDYDTFVSKYSDKRKLAHLRRIKAERLRQETNESWADIQTQSFGRLYQ